MPKIEVECFRPPLVVQRALPGRPLSPRRLPGAPLYRPASPRNPGARGHPVPDHGRHARLPRIRSADPAHRRRQRFTVRCRRRALPRPLRDGRAAVRAQFLPRPGQGRGDSAASGRHGAAGRPRRRPQRDARGGRGLDPAGIPVEPGRGRHRHRDQRGTGGEDPRPGRRGGSGRAGAPARQRDHGLLVRLRAAPVPHHPPDHRRSWDEVRPNYTAPVADAMGRLR